MSDLRTAMEKMLDLFGNPQPEEYVDGGATYRLAMEVVAEARSALKQESMMQKALEPFAEAARWYDRDYCSGDVVLWQSRYGISVSLNVDHLWNARDALKKES